MRKHTSVIYHLCSSLKTGPANIIICKMDRPDHGRKPFLFLLRQKEVQYHYQYATLLAQSTLSYI